MFSHAADSVLVHLLYTLGQAIPLIPFHKIFVWNNYVMSVYYKQDQTKRETIRGRLLNVVCF